MKKYLFVFVLLLIVFGVSNVYALELTEDQKALVETMDAYYRKGKFIQYDGYRASYNTYPELATSQNTVYTHCSNFAYNVYKNALSIEPPVNSVLTIAHAYYDDTSEDVIRFWNKDELTNYKNVYATDIPSFITNVISEDIQVGDILVTFRTSAAHTMLVYDITYDSNGKVSDVMLIDSNSKYEQESTKLGTNGLSYDSTGSIHKIELIRRIRPFLFNNTANDYLYLALVRPLAVKNRTGNNKYIYSNCDREKNANIYDLSKFHCSETELKDFAITNNAKSRMKYSNIDIDKTVTNEDGIINGSEVELKDELVYKIKITNNSDSVYNNLVVKEKVSEYVDIVENEGTLKDGTITWTVSIPARSATTVTYKAKVKNNTSNYGKEIVSTGSVDNIKTPPIKNKIAIGFSEEDKDKLMTAYVGLSASTKSGLDFVDEVYSKAFGIDLKFNTLDIEDLINNDLKNNDPKTIGINANNRFSSLVYNNYYGALKFYSNVYNMKYWENSWLSNAWNGTLVEGRSERKDTIYKEHFETGDVLVFKNSNDPKTSDDGVYAYIYLNDSFYGINKDSKNEFSTRRVVSNENPYLNTLLGKDNYVVLRPSYLINKLPEVEVPDTFMSVNNLTTLLAIIFIGSGLGIFIKTINKKKEA